jgi:hypothetical protein
MSWKENNLICTTLRFQIFLKIFVSQYVSDLLGIALAKNVRISIQIKPTDRQEVSLLQHFILMSIVNKERELKRYENLSLFAC